MRPLITVLLVALAACIADPPEQPVRNPGNFATAANGWFRGDLHFHTNHSEDALRQGGDDLGPALEIADAFRDPAYIAAFPDREGDGLDFVVVTDHRTDAPLHDPDFRHDHLILVGGEEYGGSGHANIIGLKKHVPHQPQAGESEAQRHIDAIAEAHAQGALFSVNHPTQDNRWPWDMEHIDALEVWNGPWSAFFGESSLEELDSTVAGAGVENPYIRGGISRGAGGGANHQALWMWYGLLSRGRHIPLIGGSDRHMLLTAGLPTTYVRQATGEPWAGRKGRELGAEGIVESLREGGTFVSNSPHGPQVLLEAEGPGGERLPVGSALTPGTWTIHARVSRAAGGVLRLVGGPLLPGDGPVVAQAAVLHEHALDGIDVRTSWSWQVPAGGGWLHGVVLVPRLVDPFPPELEHVKQAFSKLPQGKALGSMLQVFGVLVDPALLLEPEQCSPPEWDLNLAQCVPSDRSTLATFYFPESIVRLTNTWFEDGEPTEWALGALTSAFFARGE